MTSTAIGTAIEAMTGTDTVRILRQNGVKSRICGLSANHEEDTFLESGANDFWLKPFPCNPKELEVALAKLLSKKNLYKEGFSV